MDNEETTTQETGGEATEAEEQQPAAEVKAESEAEKPAEEEQPKAEKVEKEPKAEKAASKSKPAAKKVEKAKSAAGGVAIDDIMATIKNMTVLELSELVKTLEAEFGVTAAAPMMAAAPAAVAAPAEEAEEKTEFTVILKAIGENKINVIRAVRELTSLGLKESKDLVEGAPQPVREGINRDEANAAKQKLEEAGATADIT